MGSALSRTPSPGAKPGTAGAAPVLPSASPGAGALPVPSALRTGARLPLGARFPICMARDSAWRPSKVSGRTCEQSSCRPPRRYSCYSYNADLALSICAALSNHAGLPLRVRLPTARREDPSLHVSREAQAERGSQLRLFAAADLELLLLWVLSKVYLRLCLYWLPNRRPCLAPQTVRVPCQPALTRHVLVHVMTRR